MLSLNQLSYTINNQALFSDLSVTMLSSSITYIKGANGCGKTSLLRMVACLQKPTSGLVSFSPYLANEEGQIRCTYVGHKLGLKAELTVLENIKFWSSIYDSLETLEAALYYFKLHDILDKKCYQLSAGNQKKVALARLLACQSNLWLLDEVESNLDQENKALLNNLIVTKANNNGIVLITSHEAPTIKTANTLNLDDYRG